MHGFKNLPTYSTTTMHTLYAMHGGILVVKISCKIFVASKFRVRSNVAFSRHSNYSLWTHFLCV